MGENYYKDVIDILKTEAGAYFVRHAKGSHERWRTSSGTPLTIPHNLKKRTTANGILKQVGLDKRF